MLTSDNMDIDTLEYAYGRLRGLAHPMRIEILELLAANKQMTVTQIYEKMNIEQAVASHHLTILKNKRAVLCVRSGKNAYYLLNEDSIALFEECVEALTKK